MFANTMRAGAVLALASSAVGGVVERLAAVPAGWTETGAPAADKTITLTISMSPSNWDAAVNRLYEMSTPSHPSYGQHMQREEVNAMIAPSAAAKSAVLAWLKSSGATGIKESGLSVDFAMTAAAANKMFDTTFNYYEKDAHTILRTTEYSVPADIQDYVDIVVPTVYFSAPSTAVIKPYTAPVGTTDDASLAKAPCDDFISPSCIKELYNVGEYVPDNSYGSNVGFGSFLNQSASYADLSGYEGFYGIPAQKFAVELIRGGVNNQSSANGANVGEADLDVQNIVGVSNPLPVREYITGGSPPTIPDINQPPGDNENEPYYAYYNYLLAQSNADLPQVLTQSYGDVEETVPPAYARTVCNLIAQIGMRGITVLHSSGDLGVGSGCRSDITHKPRFEPIFPATCPYVTSVGGTQAINPEIAWVAGSGGFSNYFKRPSYQDGMIETYLDKYISPATLSYYQPYFNQSGRGFPDVSAHSLTPDYLVVYEGVLSRSGGTSAASPVLAAIVGFLNDARFRQKKPALGFLNPMLYSTGYAALNDITGGGSVGCNGVDGQTGMPVPGNPGIIPYASWNATVGWDPVTGLGTPNFGKLIQLLAPSS